MTSLLFMAISTCLSLTETPIGVINGVYRNICHGGLAIGKKEHDYEPTTPHDDGVHHGDGITIDETSAPPHVTNHYHGEEKHWSEERIGYDQLVKLSGSRCRLGLTPVFTITYFDGPHEKRTAASPKALGEGENHMVFRVTPTNSIVNGQPEKVGGRRAGD